MPHEHDTTIEEVRKQFGVILNESKQAIYAYLDDTHRPCNERFASMRGYESAEEWSRVTKPFTEVFVQEKSRHSLVSAFQRQWNPKAPQSSMSHGKIRQAIASTQVILVPTSVEGELLAMHCITEV